MRLFVFDPQGIGAIVVFVVFLAYRVLVPYFFARKAERKGYKFYLLYLLGLIISPILCIIVTLLLPDKHAPKADAENE